MLFNKPSKSLHNASSTQSVLIAMLAYSGLLAFQSIKKLFRCYIAIHTYNDVYTQAYVSWYQFTL